MYFNYNDDILLTWMLFKISLCQYLKVVSLRDSCLKEILIWIMISNWNKVILITNVYFSM